jgi:hypothetical protein
MEVGEFIEQDILIFLDDKIDIPRPERAAQTVSTLYMTRDYEKELTSALSRDEVTAAKQVLHELKNEFDTCPNGTADKEQLKLLLTMLYEKIKDYLDAKHIPATSAFQAAQPTTSPVSTPDILQSLVEQAETYTRTQEFKLAVDAYRKAKKEASNRPAVPDELTKRLLALYQQLRQTIVEKRRDPAQEMDRQLLLQIEQEKHSLDQSLHNSDIRAAIEQYKKMRILAQQLQSKSDAYAAAQKLQRIYAILELLKSTHHEQHLAKALP